MLPVPCDKPRYALADPGARLEPQVAPRRFNVGESLLDVAWLHRQHLFGRGPTKRRLEGGDERQQRLGPMIADII